MEHRRARHSAHSTATDLANTHWDAPASRSPLPGGWFTNGGVLRSKSGDELVPCGTLAMKPVTEELIRQMVGAIVAEAQPERVILFGSQARGDAGEASDVDFIVVDSAPFNERRSRRLFCVRLYEALAKFRVPTDILVYSRHEFDYWSDSLNHVVGRAVAEGRVLYERP